MFMSVLLSLLDDLSKELRLLLIFVNIEDHADVFEINPIRTSVCIMVILRSSAKKLWRQLLERVFFSVLAFQSQCFTGFTKFHAIFHDTTTTNKNNRTTTQPTKTNP